MKRIAQIVVSLAFSGLILYALFRKFDIAQAMLSVRRADPRMLMLGVALMVLAYGFRAARWRIWERTLSFGDSLGLVLIGFMGNNVLPARLGEVLRSHCAAAKTSDDRGRTNVLASVAAERILDGLILGVFALLATKLVAMDRGLKLALFLLSAAFAALTSCLVFGIHYHERIRSCIAAANRRFPGHVTAFAREKAMQFLDGLLPLGTMPRLLKALVGSWVIWTVEALCCYYIGLAVWREMRLQTALLFLVVVNFASLVPFTMGGVGSIEAVAPMYLMSSGLPAHAAFAMVLLQHGVQYVFTTIAGGIAYVGGGFYRISFVRPKEGLVTAAVRQAASQPRVMEAARSSLDRLRETVQLRPAARDDIELSIVIPAFNEQSRLPRTVLETIHWCTTRDFDFELIIVDDGSRDQTLSLGRLFEQSDVRIHTIACPHAGKGATVRMGILNARGRSILFMDADGATPMNEILKLTAALKDGHDIAIGSRVVQHPGDVEVKTSFHRRVVGRIFAFFVNIFAIEGIADTQCGFKLFRRDAARAIFSRQKTVGFAFDVEILFIAHRLNLSVAEIPVNWVSQPGSKVNLITDSLKMLWDISHIRWLHRNLERGTLAVPSRSHESAQPEW